MVETDLAHNNPECVIRAYGHAVQSLAFTYLKNIHDAEDAAQDVFITYLTKAPRFTSARKEKAWLMTVTVNRCKSILRKAWRKEVPISEALRYLPQEESMVLQAVLALEEKYRLSIHLHYYEGYTLSEIAKILHTKPATVGSWLARGRDKLKNKLGGDYFEE